MPRSLLVFAVLLHAGAFFLDAAPFSFEALGQELGRLEAISKQPRGWLSRAPELSPEGLYPLLGALEREALVRTSKKNHGALEEDFLAEYRRAWLRILELGRKHPEDFDLPRGSRQSPAWRLVCDFFRIRRRGRRATGSPEVLPLPLWSQELSTLPLAGKLKDLGLVDALESEAERSPLDDALEQRAHLPSSDSSQVVFLPSALSVWILEGSQRTRSFFLLPEGTRVFSPHLLPRDRVRELSDPYLSDARRVSQVAAWTHFRAWLRGNEPGPDPMDLLLFLHTDHPSPERSHTRYLHPVLIEPILGPSPRYQVRDLGGFFLPRGLEPSSVRLDLTPARAPLLTLEFASAAPRVYRIQDGSWQLRRD